MTSVEFMLTMIPILLLIEGFFSGAEIAILSADRIKLKAAARKGSGRSNLALELSARPERVLSATLLMTSVCIILISSLIALYFIEKSTPHAELWAVVITSPLIVIFGELIPKTLFQRYSTVMAPWAAYPVTIVYYLFFPITRLLSGYTNRLSRMLGPIEELIAGRKHTTRDELRLVLSFGKNESALKPSEKKMIKRIFDFKDTEAKHALIPLVKVEAIEEQSTIRQALDRFKTHRHSRMPVYSGRVDNITGVLDVSDLFGMVDLSQPIRTFIAPAHYVAETQSLEDVLLDMHRESDELVVIVDEYGGAVGILSLEDIVEEIVGEIQDEYDSEGAKYKELGPESWLIQSRMEISQINELLHLSMPEGDYETLGGFLLQQFGRIPGTRDELYFDTKAGSLKFTIRKATERQIDSVLVELLSKNE
ncbi:MAG: HlyC/CorC family transporter [Bdellovibrionales bacterium]|nr:HlyC/CorC family transporter [Bdellovibrionales bacterium]